MREYSDLEIIIVELAGLRRFRGDYKSLFRNPNISREFISENRMIDSISISENPYLTWSDILNLEKDKNASELYEIYSSIANNQNITMKTVKQNPRKYWNSFEFASNPNVTFEIFQENFNFFMDYDGFSCNKNLTIEIIENHPEINFNYDMLSLNPNITVDFIEKHIDEDWSWILLSKNKNLTLSFIEKYIDILDQTMLIKNDALTFDDIMYLLSKKLLRNDVIEKYLAANPNITWEFIQSHPEIKWDMESFSCNPNLTWKIFRDNPEIKWDYAQISLNKFKGKRYYKINGEYIEIKKYIDSVRTPLIMNSNRTYKSDEKINEISILPNEIIDEIIYLIFGDRFRKVQ